MIPEIIAIFLGPIAAVCITLWWQQRKEKRDAQIRLFLTLMAFRKSNPVSYEWAQSLNLIDVVFSNSPKVTERWRKYYDNLRDRSPDALNERIPIYLELMSAMAKAVGFRNLEQTAIDRFYYPEAHGKQAELNADCQTEWLRVLKATSRFEAIPIPASEVEAVSGASPQTSLADLRLPGK